MARKKCKRSSSSWFGSLPNDLLVDIFERCPLKTLMRFKCVSKSCCSIIQLTLDSFYKSQRVVIVGRYEGTNNIQLYSIDGKGVATQSSMFARERDFKFCNNGFVCLHNGHRLRICNLNTPKVVTLPNSDNISNFEFGFDPLKKEYKVLAWGFGYRNNCLNYLVFTIGTNSWRDIRNRPADEFSQSFINSFCMNGTFYWYGKNQEIIISFDLANEEFGTIQGPARINHGMEYRKVEHLFEFDGCLCLLDDHHDLLPRIRILDLWILKEDNDKKVWLLMTSITLPTICVWLQIPYSTRTGEIVLGVSTTDRSDVIYLYSFLTNKITKMAGLGSDFIVCNFRGSFDDLEDDFVS